MKNHNNDSDDYFAETINFIHLNLVEARLCRRPEIWEQSDFREWVGLIKTSRNIAIERDNIFESATDYIGIINDELENFFIQQQETN